jgi:CheY-like chemotaxis protein
MYMTETSPLRAQRILVVDDEPFVCEAVKLLLATDGHSVETAANGREALAKYDPAKFDLVITDFAMEGMKGDELAEKIKGRAPNKPIILLTAFPPEKKPAAIDLVMTKPFYFETLRAGLAEVLGVESGCERES